MDEMLYCGDCGERLRPGVAFCGRCGALASRPDPAPATEHPRGMRATRAPFDRAVSVATLALLAVLVLVEISRPQPTLDIPSHMYVEGRENGEAVLVTLERLDQPLPVTVEGGLAPTGSLPCFSSRGFGAMLSRLDDIRAAVSPSSLVPVMPHLVGDTELEFCPTR